MAGNLSASAGAGRSQAEDEHCIWNRRTLCIVHRGSMGALLSAAQQWNQSNRDSFVVVPVANVMNCSQCGGQQRAFVASRQSTVQNVDLVCDRCRHPRAAMQDSGRDEDG